VTVNFQGWRRPAIAVGGAVNAHGRMATSVPLLASIVDLNNAPVAAVPQSVPVELLGPGDVAGLAAGTVRTVAPLPGAAGFETSHCPYVELATAELPWRYTAEGNRPGTAGARPWMVLVVATGDELTPLPDGRVQLSATLTSDYNLAESWRWAHLQQQDGVELARIASERKLGKSAAYTAALVAAFDASGADAWTVGQPAIVACFHRWSFSTADDTLDFASMAAALHPQAADGLGVVDVRYRGHVDQTLPTRGALTTRDPGPADDPLPADIAADLASRRAVGGLPVRPTVLGLPAYGDVWADPNVVDPLWLDLLNADPRTRLVSGLGVQSGILEQDLLLASARTKWGDTLVAADRIRSLAMGLAAAGSLWRRRLPVAPERRLLLYGPALAGLITDSNWTVLDLMTMPGRPLRRAFFSGAGQRARRAGTGRRARRGGIDPVDLLIAANRCLPPPVEAKELPDAAGAGRVLGGQGRGNGTSFVDQVLTGNLRSDYILAANLADGLKRMPGSGYECEPVDLGALVAQLDRIIDPTSADAPARRRVLWPIDGLDDPTLAPVEPCGALDLPAWRFARDHAKRWLLPGAENLEANGVTALETNPVFIDAYLVGLNQQTVGELRWRNLPVRSGCTPIRRFWDVVDSAGTAHDDVKGIALWPSSSKLGDATHRPPGAPNLDLVVVLRTELFRRYPDTLIYLVTNNNDFSKPPPDPTLVAHIPPVFVGEVERDLPFFGFPVDPSQVKNNWVVIEQVPHGYHFYNRQTAAGNGASDGGDWAAKTFVEPVRVFLDLGGLAP
jgi:hypothetical protein